MARKPSSSGSSDEPSLCEPTPTTDGLSSTIMKAEMIKVTMPRMMPFGMSRLGSTDSSAANGNCSMARNSQTAKGSDARIPEKPIGNHGPLPSGSSDPSGAMLSAQRLKSMLGKALNQKMISTASDTSVTMSVTRKDRATPKILRPRKIK